MYLPRVFLTPPPLIPYTTQEITGCTNEAAKSERSKKSNFLFFV